MWNKELCLVYDVARKKYTYNATSAVHVDEAKIHFMTRDLSSVIQSQEKIVFDKSSIDARNTLL